MYLLSQLIVRNSNNFIHDLIKFSSFLVLYFRLKKQARIVYNDLTKALGK